jgi:hypothetical protein
MNRRYITILLLVIFVSGFFSGFPVRSIAVENTYQEKLLFFSDKHPFSLTKTQIDSLKQKQEIAELETFPKLNAIRIKATENCLKTITLLYPQLTIIDNLTYKSQPIRPHASTNTQTDIHWNLDLIHVKEMWEKGFSGKGVKIGVLDTGADSTHPALTGKIKDFALFDKYGTGNNQKTAYDTDTHGTHVSGIVAGGSLKEPLGVAPDATLSVGVVIPGGSGSFSQIIGGLEWLLDPDGNPATNDSPRAVNLSLGLPGYVTIWTPLFQKLLARNILPVCSIGNEGDGISSSPGNTPNAFSVGAFDKNKKPAYFSSGSDQIKWEDSIIQSDVYLKPDISAPGVAIRSSVPNNGYELMSGTSMASPHIAGAAAVLAQAFPDATAYDLYYFLKAGSQDEGKKGPDTRFGQGSLDIFSSWKLLNQAKRVTGKLKNYSSDYTLTISETGLPIYVNSDQEYSVFLSPGSYHLEIRNQQKVVQTLLITVTSKNVVFDITLPTLMISTLDGKVKNGNGKPILATIISRDSTFSTNEMGYFSIPCRSMDEIIIQASGYKETKVLVSDNTPSFLNVTLEKVKVLLVEGTSNYLAIKNPPRLARNYYFQALTENQIPFAYQNTSLAPIQWEDIESFDTIIYFFESGSFSREEGKLLSRFLDNGGKLLVTGRMIMFLENFMDLTFLGDHFGVSSKETISFPSISNMDDDNGFTNLQFALTGNEGANNQENCDVLQKRESSITPIPFLKFNEIGKDRYAGVLATNGVFRGIFLPFGFEGIGASQSRTELMRKMMNWLNQTGTMEIKMPSDAPFYIELKKDTGYYFSKMVESGIFTQKNLPPGNYHILVQGYGYESFETSQFINVKDQVSLWIYPKKSTFQKVSIKLNQYKGTTSYIEAIFNNKSIFIKEYGSEDSYQFDLPSGDFTFIIRAPLYETKFYQTIVKKDDQEIKIDMKQNGGKLLLIDDSETGDYLLDRYARIGEYYQKYLASTPFRYYIWSIAEKGKPTFLDMVPYKAVLYITGLNMLSLDSISEKEELKKYLDKNGRIILSGNYVHTVLQNTDLLHQYFGVEVKSSNVREQAVRGAPNSPFNDLFFDISDNFSENGIYVPFGSFEQLDPSVQPLFQYYSGEIASTYFKGSTFKSIFIPFGIDNIMRSTLRIDVLNRMIKLILAD